jgi:hypothetical protein
MSKFTFGDEVKVKDSAPPSVHPGTRGAIVSIQSAEDRPRYTVEFGDGSDCEIEEDFLEKVSD